MLFGFPDRKHGSRGILDDCHASVIVDIERRGKDFSAKLARALCRIVGAFDAHVEIPVRRNSYRHLVPANGVSGRDDVVV